MPEILVILKMQHMGHMGHLYGFMQDAALQNKCTEYLVSRWFDWYR